MARRILVPLAAAALVLGAAGCGPDEPEPRKTDLIDLSGDDPSDGGGEQPSDGGGGEPSDGGGEEPVNAAPDIPAPDPADYSGMEENTEQGAMHALRYYMAVTYWAHQSGDAASLDTLSDEECVTCSELVAEVGELKEGGQLWEGGEVRDIELLSFDSESYDAEIGYAFSLGEHTEFSISEGGRVVVPETEMLAAAVMDWRGGGWVIRGLQV